MAETEGTMEREAPGREAPEMGEPEIQTPETAEAPGVGSKKILMVVAQANFKDEEYFTPKDTFESVGFDVRTVSKNMGMAKSVGGQEVEVSGVVGENGDDYDAVVLIGGPGIISYYMDTDYQQVARQAFEGGKIVGAICLAPNILANGGILEGKRATVFGSETQLVSHGAAYTGESVTVDGNIITGIGPDAAAEFADAIVRMLSST